MEKNILNIDLSILINDYKFIKFIKNLKEEKEKNNFSSKYIVNYST